jgi:hypothetical protein
MAIKSTPHAGWQNNLQLHNDHVELIVSLDVGPRVLCYKTLAGTNVFKTYPDQLGKSGEKEWMIRGGHRLWIAPENEELSYVPDNVPVKHEMLPPHGVRLVNDGVDPWKIRKELRIALSEHSSEVTVEHLATNEGDRPVEIATWGLSVMVPGGLEIIPTPPPGHHPADLLPNRVMVIWPYTDMSDARWRFGWRYITVRQAPEGGPSKIGLAHREGWVAYLTKNTLFVKTFEHLEGEKYPDLGCNFETFTNPDMIEIESLGPLKTLAPGESTGHVERWYLLGNISLPHSLKETELHEWIEPLLASLGIKPQTR